MPYYLTLFVNHSEDSYKAEKLLRVKGLLFSRCTVQHDDEDVSVDDLPLLISGQGRCIGYEDIKLYTDYLQKRIGRQAGAQRP